MPWMETCAVEQRLSFVRDVMRGLSSKAAFCRAYGISRPTGDKWLRRFEERGVDGLEDSSSAPHHHPNRMAESVAEAVLALRRAHMTWGPRKLRAYLERQDWSVCWPVASTIGELLREHGLVVPRRRRHRTPPYARPFGDCGQANSVWCADFKGWFRTGDGWRCHPLTMMDAFSRYLLRCQGLRKARHEPTKAVFESAFREYGLPLAIRTDNGPPFASKAIGGLSRLAAWWLKLGIVPERIEVGHPEQNGRHERMHLTLKNETVCPPQLNMRRQQRRFDGFRSGYNHDRPHEALGQRTPGEFYQASGREYPARIAEVEYPSGMTIRRVRNNGEIKWRGKKLYLAELLAGEPVGLELVSEDRWLVYFCRMPLVVLDDRRQKLWDVETALRKGWLDSDALPSPFRCAPGPGQSVET